jgi:NADPH:quinone reductase-like Zn-dependent oxidoreductase
MLLEQSKAGRANLRAIRIHRSGGPDVLKLEEVELPKPGPGEVRLSQHAVGVNYIDIYYRNGFYPAPHMPLTPGSEGAGEVVEVGRGSRTSSPATGLPTAVQSAPTPMSATSRRGSSSS